MYKSYDHNVNFLNCNCQYITLNQDNVHFVVCSKKVNEIEDFFGAKQGQGFKTSAAYTNIATVPPSPLDAPGSLQLKNRCIDLLPKSPK